MKGIRYIAEFKAEALKQITERRYVVVKVFKRLGVSDKKTKKGHVNKNGR